MEVGTLDLIGKSLGKYRVQEWIAEGGMGVVFRAYHPDLRVDVALKVLGGDAVSDRGAIERFRREVLTLARLSHPNVVPILDAGVSDDLPFLVMPLIPHPTLHQELLRHEAEGQPYPIDRALDITQGILEALEAVHGLGAVHRDIKPTNVFVEADEGRAMLTDFGLARSLDDRTLTRTGAVVGTLSWMAPEQLEGKPVDRRADLYQTGLILYRMLSGRLPFEEDLADCVRVKCLLDALPPPTREGRPLQDALTRCVMFLAARDPSRRPDSATSALAALKRTKEAVASPLNRHGRSPARPAGASFHVPSSDHSEPRRGWWRAHPVRGALAASLALALVTVLSTFLPRLGPRDASAPGPPVRPAAGKVPSDSRRVAPSERAPAPPTPAMQALSRAWPGARSAPAEALLARLLSSTPETQGAAEPVRDSLSAFVRHIPPGVEEDLARRHLIPAEFPAWTEGLRQDRPPSPENVRSLIQVLRDLDEKAFHGVRVLEKGRESFFIPLTPGRKVGEDIAGLLATMSLLYPGFHQSIGSSALDRIESLATDPEVLFNAMLGGSGSGFELDRAIGGFLLDRPTSGAGDPITE